MGQTRRILRIHFLLDELFLLLSEVVHYVRMHKSSEAAKFNATRFDFPMRFCFFVLEAYFLRDKSNSLLRLSAEKYFSDPVFVSKLALTKCELVINF